MGFLFGLVMLVGQHAGFLAAGSAAFLAADGLLLLQQPHLLFPAQEEDIVLVLRSPGGFLAGEKIPAG